ncbi:hypothetical protein ACFQWA_09960 [Streptomyces thermogriseus]|uniref:Uncharacterized protein n=1 Tax=Streptomyces thermogriseus TaxID=75292 RepID=A0ABN1SU51_9ACTN
MPTLMRAPRPCGSWFWDLCDAAEPGLRSALDIAASMAEALKKFDLLTPIELEYGWYVLDAGSTGVTSKLTVSPDPLEPTAEVAVHQGIWSWFDFSGRPHSQVYRGVL